MDEDDFLALVTAGQPAAPDYFVYDAVLNRTRARGVRPARHARPLDLPEVLDLQRRRRGGGRRPRPAGVRHRPSGRLPQRPGGRPVRRDRGHGRAARRADRRDRPAGPRGGGRHPARPHRLRPRRRLPARTRGGVPRARPSASPAPAGSPHRSSPPPCAPRCRRFCSTSATPASSPRAPSPAPGTSRSRSCRTGSARSRRTGPWSPTAPAATAPASRPHCCVGQATPTSRTCSAATAPGRRSRNRSAEWELGRLRGGRAGWCTGDVTRGSSTRHTFCVCLLAMDQLSVDDRRCRPALRRS